MRCPFCGHGNAASARFCSACGRSLGASPESAPATQRHLRASIPRELAEKLLASRADHEGTSRTVTLLFAEARPASAIPNLDPGEGSVIQERFQRIVRDSVYRFEGAMSQHSSEVLLAFFGAPIPHEDHAERACYAALQVSRELQALAAELRRTGRVNLSSRVALSPGELTLEGIADNLELEYGAAPDPLELGWRVLHLVESGRIYLTDAPAREVQGLFDRSDLGPVDLGASTRSHLYELRGLSPMRNRVNRARSSRLPRFIERRRVAVLNADAVGYSRLMAADEVDTVMTLTAYREIMTSLIHQRRGRVVDSPGDNLLAEFREVTAAVRCAAEIQRAIRAQNDELPENRRMEFRVGIHFADVMVEGERLYGDGINIAARLERLSEPGGVCISGRVFEEVRDQLDFDYEFLGDQRVKNIPDPVRVYRLRSAALA